MSMTTLATIESLWASLSNGDQFPAHTRVSPDLALDLFAQVDGERRVGLLAVSAKPGLKTPAYAAVEVVIGQRTDGRWATSVSLCQAQLYALFAAMCTQIVEQGANAAAGTNASEHMLIQLAQWHRLLALGPDGLLSREEQLGLQGELVVLSAAIERFGLEVAMQGWKGPDDAAQDFALPCGFVEVKTLRSGVQFLTISSFEQLDVGESQLGLAVVELSESAKGTGGESLQHAVENVRRLAADSPKAAMVFEGQLQKAGYVDRDEYGETEYRTASVRWFAVEAAFPRLVRSQLPPPIHSGQYRLLLKGIDRFETSPFQFHG